MHTHDTAWLMQFGPRAEYVKKLHADYDAAYRRLHVSLARSLWAAIGLNVLLDVLLCCVVVRTRWPHPEYWITGIGIFVGLLLWFSWKVLEWHFNPKLHAINQTRGNGFMHAQATWPNWY